MYQYLGCAVLAALGGCALGTGKLTTSPAQMVTTNSGGTPCYTATYHQVSCSSVAAVDQHIGDSDSTPIRYTLGPGGFGMQFGLRRGWASTSLGDRSGTGTGIDAGLEIIYNRLRYGGSLDIGYTYQGLGIDAASYAGWFTTARWQFNFGALGLYAGLGYVFSGTLTSPDTAEMDASAARVLGGLRFPLEVGWGSFTELVFTAEVQHTQGFDNSDYAANAILGGVTMMLQP